MADGKEPIERKRLISIGESEGTTKWNWWEEGHLL